MIKLVSLLEVKIPSKDMNNPQFMSGLHLAIQDKKDGVNRDVEGFTDDFIRGYNIVERESWWDRVNTKLTNWSSQFGSSMGDTNVWKKK